MPDASASILKDIASGKIAPLYYLFGDPYPLEQIVAALRKAVLKGGESAFNFDALLAKEAGPAGILSAARTMPMMGPQRLVQVRDMHLFKADELNELLSYVQAPSPSTCLLLLAEKGDLRLKFFSAAKKTGVVARFDPLKERQVPAWVADEARRLKIKLKSGAAESVSEAVGTDMAQLASALDRLSLFAGPGNSVTVAHVEELLAQTRKRSIFELTNAVGRGKRGEALLVLKKMLQAREPGVRIVAMLARHLRQLWSAKELRSQGKPPKGVAAAIGVHPFFINDIIKQADRFNRRMMQRTHRALFEADRKLKSSRLSDAAILEGLVVSLCPAER